MEPFREELNSHDSTLVNGYVDSDLEGGLICLFNRMIAVGSSLGSASFPTMGSWPDSEYLVSMNFFLWVGHET